MYALFLIFAATLLLPQAWRFGKVARLPNRDLSGYLPRELYGLGWFFSSLALTSVALFRLICPCLLHRRFSY